MTTAVKSKAAEEKPTPEDAVKKALTVAFDVLETAGKQVTKFAKEGKKKVATLDLDKLHDHKAHEGQSTS